MLTLGQSAGAVGTAEDGRATGYKPVLFLRNSGCDDGFLGPLRRSAPRSRITGNGCLQRPRLIGGHGVVWCHQHVGGAGEHRRLEKSQALKCSIRPTHDVAAACWMCVTRFSVTNGVQRGVCAQAFGAEQYETMTIIFQRTVLFLAAHMAPITAVVLSVPGLCRRMGQPDEVVDLMMPYILISLPGVWLDTVDRPMNRMLVAQQIALPQMYISGFGMPRPRAARTRAAEPRLLWQQTSERCCCVCCSAAATPGHQLRVLLRLRVGVSGGCSRLHAVALLLLCTPGCLHCPCGPRSTRLGRPLLQGLGAVARLRGPRLPQLHHALPGELLLLSHDCSRRCAALAATRCRAAGPLRLRVQWLAACAGLYCGVGHARVPGCMRLCLVPCACTEVSSCCMRGMFQNAVLVACCFEL